MAGDCWRLRAPRDGNHGSSSWDFSVSVLLDCCPLHGFMRPQSNCEGRRASQQKRPINKDLPPPAELQHGRRLPLLPASEPCLSHSKPVHLSSHSAKPQSPMLVSFGRAPAPGVNSATAGLTDGSTLKLPITVKGGPVP